MNNEEREIILKEAIVRTIVFFDLFDYPLSPYEIWQYLEESATLLEIRNILSGELKGIETKDGFYFLESRQDIALIRQKRYNFSLNKLKLAQRAANIFRLVPFIRMIAVSNIIGAHNLRDGSDIDLFIITSSRRLWLTRLFCAGLAKILGWRPTPSVKRNRICLSFYTSLDALNLVSLKLEKDDLYFNYWLAGLVPIFDRYQTYGRFIKENAWIKDCLPNWQEARVNSLNGIKKQLSHVHILSGVLDKLEKKSLDFQLKIMPLALKSLINVDTRVRVDDKIIKLYLVDRRREFLEKFSLRLDQVLNK